MKHLRAFLFPSILSAAALAVLSMPPAAAADHWVATWGASMLATNIPAAPPAAPVAAGAPAAQAAKPQPLRSFNNQTVRMIVRASIPGRTLRVQLSNTYGTEMLKIGSAHIALRDEGSAIIPASDSTLTFSGSPTAMIPAGSYLISDPVSLNVPALGDIAVSLFFPSDTGAPTQHATGLHTTYISGNGDFAGQKDFTATRTTNSWYFLSNIAVLAPEDAAAIVTYGDSITDGATSTNDADASWPSQLARRLANAGATNLAVVNQGISGNRVLRDGAGTNALARFDRDVLSQPGVKYLVIMEGINDIGQGLRQNADPANAVTAQDIIAGYRQMIDRAHMAGIKVIGATLTPYEGAAYFSDAGEVIRAAVNDWIRTTGMFDAVFDFDKVTQDPSAMKKFRSNYNIRDNLHPNDAGYQAMADSIDLSVFGVETTH